MPKKQSQKNSHLDPTKPDYETFGNKLIAWYLVNQRDLPWRNTRDPYYIWLSEIILQQTRVLQGLPYYLKFVETYPTVQDLALAEEKDVLRTWQGLGYYTRARNLHKAARQIVAEFAGEFPDTYAELIKLRGIGAYSAAAIASFAFDEEVAAVDGNVFRVLARLFGIQTDIAGSKARAEFKAVAEMLMPAGKANLFNQALIEFGAIQCKPVSPDCSVCIFKPECYAFQHGAQGLLPVKQKKLTVKERNLYYIALEWNGKLAMKERSGRDIWKGLYDFYLLEADKPVALEALLESDDNVMRWRNAGIVTKVYGPFTHLLTHQRLMVQFIRLTFEQDARPELPAGLEWYAYEAIEHLPKPVIIGMLFDREW